MFSIQDRNLVRDYVLQLARSDVRVVAGAVVGSLALSDGDRWSDLDLTFAVADDYSILDVLEDWTSNIVKQFNATQLFDLPRGASIYRVFLLPGCLQFDLSFTPASKFGAIGPKFKVLFGKAVEKPYSQPPDPQELFGYAVHHTPSERAFASNAGGIGRRNTGLVELAIMPFTSLVCAVTFRRQKVEASMIYHRKFVTFSAAH